MTSFTVHTLYNKYQFIPSGYVTALSCNQNGLSGSSSYSLLKFFCFWWFIIGFISNQHTFILIKPGNWCCSVWAERLNRVSCKDSQMYQWGQACIWRKQPKTTFVYTKKLTTMGLGIGSSFATRCVSQVSRTRYATEIVFWLNSTLLFFFFFNL